MSDTEKTDASPQKEEVNVESKSDMVDEKPKENEKEVEEEEEEAMEEEVKKDEEVEEEKMEDAEEEQEIEDKSEPKTESVDTTPKKSPKKRKKIEKKEDDEEEEELPLGLLERPVVIESGKREKKKVERLSMTVNFTPQQKKIIDVPVGSGAKLGDCPRIEYNITHRKTDDLKTLHRILYGKKGGHKVVKKNLRQFSGFNFVKDDKDYKGRLVALGKLTVSALKTICDVIDLEKMGVKDEVVQRVMDFLMKPTDSGKKIPKPKKKGKPPKSGDKKEDKGTKRKRTVKKKGEKKKGQKKQTSREDVDSDNDDDDEDDVEENDKDDDVDEDGDLDEDEEESEEEEEAPKKKKIKIETKKPKKDSEKKNDKKEKKEKPAKKEKKEPKKKRVETSSDEDDDDEDSGSEMASKKSGPPNNDELRDVVKKILDGANLEEVTMKTVVKQVYAKYPEYDLTDKKEFIKNTVKQLIS